MRSLLIVLMALLMVSQVVAMTLAGSMIRSSPLTETVTVEVYCWTLILAFPVFCVKDSTSSITVKEVVEMAVEEIVIEGKQEEVPVDEIVEQVAEMASEKPMAIDEAVEVVMNAVKDAVHLPRIRQIRLLLKK